MSCETIVKMSDSDNVKYKSVPKVCDNNLNNSEENSLHKPYHTHQIKENSKCKRITSVVPKYRQELLKWNGWGYRDSRFEVRDNVVHFTGRRYPIGELRLPAFTQWVVQTFNIDLQDRQPPQPPPTIYPDPVPCPEFLQECQTAGIEYSQRGEDRLQRAHGQTLHDIHTLRRGTFPRIPDVVVWPRCHQQTEILVRLADLHGVAVIPFGGGTSVSGAVTCPEQETRPVVALDTSQMNKLLWLDRDNLVACFEAGIVGQDLERELRQLGLTLGHEPDSYEFSTLGGWVATRASGMKKNEYGNIEDLLVHVRMVTPRGVLARSVAAPRISCGPDWNHVILGSEGTLGVVTEVIVKVRPLPRCRRYGSIVFPNFSSGVACLREIARRRCQPASIRLMDNAQFEFGQTLRPENSWLGGIKDALKHSYLTRVRGFDIKEICVATLAFEGESDQVARNEKLLEEIAKAHGGIPAGQTNGERGYLLTFVIAYIRDLALEYYIVAESFETSVPWDRCEALCRNVKHRLHKECSILGIKYMMISCRVTQTYDSGACVYFYFAFNHKGLDDPVRAYEELEDKARDEILASGGSLSHHHGVGKLRSRWYPDSVSAVGVDLYHATKQKLDPKNVFACGNLLPKQTTSKL